jgi:NDP-sugar pyrophosphorylase family protein
MRAVIMAGGKGRRLAPFTAVLPKPLMPLGDMPVLEFLLRQLVRHGITHATLAVGHLAPLIMAFCEDGRRFGLSLDYSPEDEPLGTAGPIGKIKDLTSTFLALNGDLLTDLDFRAMMDFHRRTGSTATVGTYEIAVPINLGVLEIGADDEITAYSEKPVLRYRVSMGAYVFEPRILEHVKSGEKMDLPDLIRALLAAGESVRSYRHPGYWLDIGRPDDYERAQQDFGALRKSVLGE